MNYDALMLVGFGGPESPEEVRPFLARIVQGRNIPLERMDAVAEHYLALGGVSPINGQHRNLLAGLQQRLAVFSPDIAGLPFVLGNRNSAPFIADSLRQLRDQGVKKVLAIATTPWVSYSSCRQYRENLADALIELAGNGDAGISVDMLQPYRDIDGIVEANLAIMHRMMAHHPNAHLVFTTHSIPMTMEAFSGMEGLYVREQRRLAATVVESLRRNLGPVTWTFAFQSRSGNPSTPWLEPDINDHLRFLKTQGFQEVIVVPVGFLTDHMEVVWDLDHDAAATAQEIGIKFHRAPTIGSSREFLDSLAQRITDAVHALEGEKPADLTVAEGLCSVHCCPNPRAEKAAVAGVCAKVGALSV